MGCYRTGQGVWVGRRMEEHKSNNMRGWSTVWQSRYLFIASHIFTKFKSLVTGGTYGFRISQKKSLFSQPLKEPCSDVNEKRNRNECLAQV